MQPERDEKNDRIPPADVPYEDLDGPAERDRRILDDYMRELGARPRMDPDEEFRVACELRDARKEIALRVLELPGSLRRRVLDDDSKGPSRGSRWELRELDDCLARIDDLAKQTGDPDLIRTSAVLREQRFRIDQARERLIVSNLGLVVIVVKRLKDRGIPILDLIQEGNLGLIRAVEKFDVDRGFKFSTYAVWWVRHGLSKAFSDSSRLIRLPANVGMALRKIRRHRTDLAKSLGREPTTAEVADSAGVPVETVERLVSVPRATQPIDDAEDSGRPTRAAQCVPESDEPSPLESAFARERQDDLWRLLDRLRDREKRILMLRFGIGTNRPRTLAEIAEMLDLSRERIRQIEGKAVRKLKAVRRTRTAGWDSSSRGCSTGTTGSRIAPQWGSTI